MKRVNNHTGNSQNNNRYSYVLNNPLKYTDPYGNEVSMETAVGASLAGFGGSLENVYSSSTAGFNLYSVSAFGNTTLISSFGVFGNVEYAANGGLTFENQTAAAYLDELSVGSSGGGDANALQIVSPLNTVTGIVASTTQGVVQSTKVGANFTYAISGNSVLLNSVANGFKYEPYVGLFVFIGADSYLSISINSATNLPYQSWTETGIDIGANLGIIYSGTQYGGWVGAGSALLYITDKAAFKAYINTVREHPDWALPPSVTPFTH